MPWRRALPSCSREWQGPVSCLLTRQGHSARAGFHLERVKVCVSYVGFHLPSSLLHTEIQSSPSWDPAAGPSPLGDSCGADPSVPQSPPRPSRSSDTMAVRGTHNGDICRTPSAREASGFNGYLGGGILLGVIELNFNGRMTTVSSFSPMPEGQWENVLSSRSDTPKSV